MRLSEKLIRLIFKFIDESMNLNSFECNGNLYQCFDKELNCVTIDLEYDSIDNISETSSKPIIKFKDLKSYITNGEYGEIVSRIKFKISEYEKIELELELKRQERLIDRLLDN